MIDYKGVEALLFVLELQNFESAAKKLFISQSAVSQRIKGLEDFYGEPVLIRMAPYQATRLGLQLVAHFKKVCLLKEEFEQELGANKSCYPISIALNRDCLETWFFDLTEDERKVFENIALEVIADDEEHTLQYFKNGSVSACLSVSEKEVIGGRVCYLGSMDYVLVASPSFVEKYFHGDPILSLKNAPAIRFDKKDYLLDRYLQKYWGFNGDDLVYHYIPSIRGFKKFALLGYGYGVLAKKDVCEELENRQLVQIFPDRPWTINLYWHYWTVQSKFYQKFNTDMISFAQNRLKSVKNR